MLFNTVMKHFCISIGWKLNKKHQITFKFAMVKGVWLFFLLLLSTAISCFFVKLIPDQGRTFHLKFSACLSSSQCSSQNVKCRDNFSTFPRDKTFSAFALFISHSHPLSSFFPSLPTHSCFLFIFLPMQTRQPPSHCWILSFRFFKQSSFYSLRVKQIFSSLWRHWLCFNDS